MGSGGKDYIAVLIPLSGPSGYVGFAPQQENAYEGPKEVYQLAMCCNYFSSSSIYKSRARLHCICTFDSIYKVLQFTAN